MSIQGSVTLHLKTIGAVLRQFPKFDLQNVDCWELIH